MRWTNYSICGLAGLARKINIYRTPQIKASSSSLIWHPCSDETIKVLVWTNFEQLVRQNIKKQLMSRSQCSKFREIRWFRPNFGNNNLNIFKSIFKNSLKMNFGRNFAKFREIRWFRPCPKFFDKQNSKPWWPTDNLSKLYEV